jgi:uncharacterized protein (TIGR00369 family)
MDHYTVPNPFVGHEGYQCFGCDPNNPIGLRLTFTRDGDEVSAEWTPRPDLEGYPGVIHGGILATLADEIGGWYGLAVLGRAGVTRELSIQYQSPARSSDGPFRIAAQCAESDEKSADIDVTVSSASGAVCATARVTYALFSDALARKRLSFPGAEAFRP